MSVTETIKDIPESELDKVIRDLKDDGCTVEKKEKQPNGKWTVVATCPEKES